MRRHAPVCRSRTAALALLLALAGPPAHPGAAAGAAGEAAPPPAGGQPAVAAAQSSPVWDVDRVVATALANHPLLGRADADTRAAAARKGAAQSGRLPSIDLDAGWGRSRNFSSSRGGVLGTSYGVQANLRHTIADFGRTGAAVGRADALLSAARESVAQTRSDVAFDARVAYYDVLRAARLANVNRDTVRQQESVLAQATAYYQAGIRARIDVARAEANLFRARAEHSAALNDLRVARITLLNRMGIDGPADFVLADTLATESVPGAVDEWMATAQENRPDLKSVAAQVEAARQNVRAARAEYRPSLTGNAGAGYAGDDGPFEERVYGLSVNLDVPIFSGFLTRNRVAEAEAQLSSARHGFTDLRRRVRLEVERAALALAQAADQISARRKSRDAAEENLRLATGRYEAGVGDIIEVTDAQTQMTASDTAAVTALYDHSVAVASLLHAIGR